MVLQNTIFHSYGGYVLNKLISYDTTSKRALLQGAKLGKEQRRTGGGTCHTPSLTEEEERILGLLSKDAVEGASSLVALL